jgi:hypothetical protein
MPNMQEMMAQAQQVTMTRNAEIQRRQQAKEFEGTPLPHPRAVFGRVECEAVRPVTSRARRHWRHQWYLDGKRVMSEVAVAAANDET